MPPSLLHAPGHQHHASQTSPMGHWGQATLRPRRWGQRQWGQTTLRPDDVEARRRWGQTTLRPGDVEARYVWVTFPNLNIGLNVATLRPMFGLKVATSRPMLSQNLIENFFSRCHIFNLLFFCGIKFFLNISFQGTWSKCNDYLCNCVFCICYTVIS